MEEFAWRRARIIARFVPCWKTEPNGASAVPTCFAKLNAGGATWVWKLRARWISAEIVGTALALGLLGNGDYGRPQKSKARPVEKIPDQPGEEFLNGYTDVQILRR